MEKEKVLNNRPDLIRIESTPLTYLLSSPHVKGIVSVEEALASRRSHRSFMKDTIPACDLSQVLWSAYGITKPLPGYSHARRGLKTAPSAGGLYPLEVYAAIGNVSEIEPGVYKYFPEEHKIVRTIDKDIRIELCAAAWHQEMIKITPMCLVYTAIFNRNTRFYGERGRTRYVCMDLGHSAQNVYLQAETLHLGTCAIGAFDNTKVRLVMQLPEEEEPLYIMPIGKYKG
jgi:SagB-type dehydrogenase family enzyme